MPEEDWGWQITPEELASWILESAGDILVLNKPAGVVCHPSKHGPWSSLAGAAREFLGAAKLHMPFRLDRETSGVMLVTGCEQTGKRLQHAVQTGRYRKQYTALMEGQLRGRTAVALPIGGAAGSLVRLKRAPLQDGTGQEALTVFEPVMSNRKGTLAHVMPATGRLHQIRVHAAAIGHPLFGDKIYGPDESLFVEFIENGWTERHQRLLGLKRQALHCSIVEFNSDEIAGKRRFTAPLANDFRRFCEGSLGLRPPDYFDFA
jgi:23S rRNA pseudouridine1911/1915/1917 synthase